MSEGKRDNGCFQTVRAIAICCELSKQIKSWATETENLEGEGRKNTGKGKLLGCGEGGGIHGGGDE